MLPDKPILYFLPDWDDRVKENYDFWKDEAIDDTKVFSHQIYDRPNFDGLLLSKMIVDKSKRLQEDIGAVGVHRYFGYDGPIFGDCGAYSYKDEKKPPFSNQDIAEYYEKLGFDIGVSIDHLCLPGNKSEWKYRQELTLQNGKKLLEIHEAQGYDFLPVGSAQGWDRQSYYHSVEKLIEYGYDFVAIGGMSSATTQDILGVLRYLQPLREENEVKFHLFGVARLNAIREFIDLGVYSFDSASPLRYAWTGTTQNYKDRTNYEGYTALRIPFLSRVRSRKYKKMVQKGVATKDMFEAWEYGIYGMVLDYAYNNKYSPEEIADEFMNFYNLFDNKQSLTLREKYIRTLQKRPWEQCGCKICEEIGVEVMIFRGNSRNRRRGFHNVNAFYSILQKIIDDPTYQIPGTEDEAKQTSLDDY